MNLYDLLPRPDVMIRLSTFTRGGWECWVCHTFTRYECFIITRNGPRWLPCCTVECYQHLLAAYESFERGQSQEWGILFPPLSEKSQPQPRKGATTMTWLVRFMRQFRGYGFAAME